MSKTIAMVAFIAAVGVVGVVVGMRRTVVDGRVLATDLFPQIKKTAPHLERIACDPEIPIDADGAVFHCTFFGDDGSTALVEYTMDRGGGLRPRPISDTPPTRSP